MVSSHHVRVADARVLQVTEKTCPVRVELHTSCGLVMIDPFSFAVMPAIVDVVIFENRPLQASGIEMYAPLGKCARKRANGFC